jgi:hypothetical protein
LEYPLKLVYACCLVALVIATSACDKEEDKFADAPAVAAPSTPEVTGTPSLAEGENDLPPSHPPIGNVGKAGGTPGATVAPPSGGDRAGFSSIDAYGKEGPLRWQAPEDWKAAKPATNFRIAEYAVPGPDGPANLGVFHFPGGGGGVSANIDRWVGQFSTADGKPAGPTAQRDSVEVDGMTVFRVDVAGTYNPGMAGGGVAQENYRMRGVIVESAAGPYFFKMVGPRGTVDTQVDAFDSLVKSLRYVE